MTTDSVPMPIVYAVQAQSPTDGALPGHVGTGVDFEERSTKLGSTPPPSAQALKRAQTVSSLKARSSTSSFKARSSVRSSFSLRTKNPSAMKDFGLAQV